MTDVLSTDDNGDRDADTQTDSGILHSSMIALALIIFEMIGDPLVDV